MLGFKQRRRDQFRNQKFPKSWLKTLQKNVPIYNHLPPNDQKELQCHILIFMAEKLFEGCGGLKINNEIKITIAAQACILLLHRKTDYYPGLRSILIYPQAYIARQVRHVASGIMAEGPETRLGESWHRGSVVLSWDDVRHSAADIHDGHNVVFHEFAHQLDSSAGKGDSTSVLENHSNYIAWARVLQKEYQNLRHKAALNQQTLLNKYGATNPAEFFAVATEYFFEKPKELQTHHSELYNELKNFYEQDPAKLY